MPRLSWNKIERRAAAFSEVIAQGMDGRRLRDNATFALTVDEQLQVNAVLQDWLGEHDPD